MFSQNVAACCFSSCRSNVTRLVDMRVAEPMLQADLMDGQQMRVASAHPQAMGHLDAPRAGTFQCVNASRRDSSRAIEMGGGISKGLAEGDRDGWGHLEGPRRG